MSDNNADTEPRGDTVDLPDCVEPDRCMIEPNPTGRREFVAIPYRMEMKAESPDQFLNEFMEMPLEWEPSAEYVAHVRENADVDGEIKFLRDLFPPVTAESVLEEPVHDGGGS